MGTKLKGGNTLHSWRGNSDIREQLADLQDSIDSIEQEKQELREELERRREELCQEIREELCEEFEAKWQELQRENERLRQQNNSLTEELEEERKRYEQFCLKVEMQKAAIREMICMEVTTNHFHNGSQNIELLNNQDNTYGRDNNL